MFKKAILLVLAVTLIVCSFSVPVMADQVTGVTVTVNGQAVSFPDQQPYIDSSTGRVFVPLRFISQAMGCQVYWQWHVLNDITVTTPTTNIEMLIGSTQPTVNGQVYTIDAPATISNGRTMVPLRFISEGLGATVNWDEASKTVTITLGDATAPPITPVVQQTTGQIDMTAAMNGTLQAPAGAAATPSDWGFTPMCKEIAFTVGKQAATLTGLDGSTREFDLGTAPMVMTPDNADDLIKHFPSIYKYGTTVEVNPNSGFALYAPFIPIAEAFGVPAANIEWDGTHLAVFGMYQHADNYRVLTVGSRDEIGKVEGNNPATSVAKNVLSFPLVVLNGQPALGITSVSDFDEELFITGGNVPNFISAAPEGYGWRYETGTAAEGCLPYKS